MTVTVTSFRDSFPAFSDVGSYPDESIQFWLDFAANSFNAFRWGTWLDTGVSLFVAHNIVLDSRAAEEAANGGTPGLSIGAISSKTGDKVSVSFDTSGSAIENGGQYNLTVYGTRYITMARKVGAGPVQIGVAAPCNGPYSSQNAWAGPWFANFPNPSNS